MIRFDKNVEFVFYLNDLMNCLDVYLIGILYDLKYNGFEIIDNYIYIFIELLYIYLLNL